MLFGDRCLPEEVRGTKSSCCHGMSSSSSPEELSVTKEALRRESGKLDMIQSQMRTTATPRVQSSEHLAVCFVISVTVNSKCGARQRTIFFWQRSGSKESNTSTLVLRTVQ